MRRRLIPDSLRARDQWIVAKSKRPIMPAEGWQSPQNQLSFVDAGKYAARHNGNPAFYFTTDDPFVGFDLDNVTQDGRFSDEARAIVQQLDSYTERSTSGTGLHIIAKGEHREDRKTTGALNETGTLEVYDGSQYFVITGEVYGDQVSVETRPEAVDRLQETYLPEVDGNKNRTTNEVRLGSDVSRPSAKLTAGVTPEQVQYTIRAYVNDDGSDVGQEVLKLWNGADLDHNSASEADMAFVDQLYFWCCGDRELMNQCFRASGRMRPKWDELHGNKSYGEMTIRNVCAKYPALSDSELSESVPSEILGDRYVTPP